MKKPHLINALGLLGGALRRPIWHPAIPLLFLAVAVPRYGFSQGAADLHVIARTGQAGLTTINNCVSINNAGLVAFRGITADGWGSFVADTNGPRAVRPISGNTMVQPNLQINDSGMLVARRGTFFFTQPPISVYVPIIGWVVIEPGYSESYDFLQSWAADGSGDMILLAEGRSRTSAQTGQTVKIGPFQSVGLTSTINNAGQVAFLADQGDWLTTSYAIATPKSGGYNTYSCNGVAFPMLADDGHIVLRAGSAATSPIVLLNYDLTPAGTIASTGSGFTALGRMPGISDDGQFVAFYGDLSSAGAATLGTTAGPGIFMSYAPSGVRTTLRLAGLTNAGSTVAFSSFDGNQRVGANRQAKDGKVVVTFVATTATGSKGVWACGKNLASPVEVSLVKVVLQSDQVDGMGPFDDFRLADPINTQGRVACWASSGTQQAVIQASITPPLTLSMFRTDAGTAENWGPEVDVDAPLALRPDAAVLGSSLAIPVTGGLVADGVTPLLIKLTETNATTAPTTYRITLATTNGGSVAGGLSSHLRLLKEGRFVAADSSGIGTITFPAHTTATADAFAYVSGIRSEDVSLSAGKTELACEISAQQVDDFGNPVGLGLSNKLPFVVRLPPIVLVHGFNSDGGWGADFKAALHATRPPDFVCELHYGITHGDKYENTYGDLFSLAALLDRELQLQVEGRGLLLPPWRNEWAYTRYNIVAHSQGGVLTRMLCAQKRFPWNPAADVTPFRSPLNFHRGRFHRIVTIGSPQNGTSLLYYLLQLRDKRVGFFKGWLLPHSLDSLYQEKFDPWGTQIANINRVGCEVDPTAKFHAVRAHISGTPPIFKLIGLNYSDPIFGSETGQQIVLPNISVAAPYSSDGVVDIRSQAVDYRTKGSLFDGADVAHAPVANLFGTVNGETGYGPVATRASGLLDGDATEFGPFALPNAASMVWKDRIDSFIEFLGEAIIDDANLFRVAARGPKDVESYTYQLSPSPTAGSVYGGVNWFAEVFGPAGITTDGVALQVDAADPQKVTVVVQESVIGDVVLYASYNSTAGKLVYAQPVVVISRPAGAVMSGISLVPAQATLVIGDAAVPEVWAHYTNGAKSRLYILPGVPLVLASSSPGVVSVGQDMVLRAQSAGASTITAAYRGFTANATLTVNPQLCFVETQASPAKAGTLSDGRFYPAGTNATVTAIANSSFSFLNWTESGTVVSTTSNYTFAVTGDRMLVAHFIPNVPILGFGSPAWHSSLLNLTLQGPIGSNYLVQGSTDLHNWLSMTNFVSTESPVQVQVPAATNSNHRFYRAVMQ